jgi:hypothetical protein
LRDAFMSTMKDPQFLADAEKAKLEITPVSGADIEKLVKEVYGTPKAMATKATAMIRYIAAGMGSAQRTHRRCHNLSCDSVLGATAAWQ